MDCNLWAGLGVSLKMGMGGGPAEALKGGGDIGADEEFGE